MKESLAYELPLFSFDIYELSRLAAQRVGLAESSEPTVAVLRQAGLARICTRSNLRKSTSPKKPPGR